METLTTILTLLFHESSPVNIFALAVLVLCFLAPIIVGLIEIASIIVSNLPKRSVSTKER